VNFVHGIVDGLHDVEFIEGELLLRCRRQHSPKVAQPRSSRAARPAPQAQRSAAGARGAATLLNFKTDIVRNSGEVFEVVQIFNVVVVQQLQKFFEVFRKSDHIRTGFASSVQQRPAALGESSLARILCHPIGRGFGKPRIFFHGVIDGFRGYMAVYFRNV
jgi:hypothetical protein